MRYLWTNDEIEILKINYLSGVPIDEICRLLPKRNPDTIIKRASELGLKRPCRWTKNEIDRLKDAYQTLDTEDLYNAFPNRDRMSIFDKARNLRLKRPIQKRIKRNIGKPKPFLTGLSNLDLGYLAGLIDGEGHIGFNKSNDGNYRLSLVIANTDKIIIDWLFEKIPDSNLYMSNENHSKRKITYHWRICGNLRIAQFLGEIAPYLVSKRHIAERLSKGYLHLETEERDKLVEFVHNFNKTGR